VGREKKDPPNIFPSAECPGQLKIPTDRELRALRAMRMVKERVRSLKAQKILLQESARWGNRDRLLCLEEELCGLRKEWDRLKEEWQAAARERMILLGHEEE
jgi:hypothetical protein